LKLLMKSDGFSLIEVLIALVILSISLLALAGLMSTTSQNTSFGGHLTEAATFAQDQLEHLRVTSWAPGGDMDNGPHQNQVTSPYSGITYTRNWNVAQNVAGTIKTITITTSWTDREFRSFILVSAISQ
jgi:prepilin-type N-terminal cleavage/methylation domain-containing protein